MWSVNDYARLLGVSYSSIHSEMCRGELVTHRQGQKKLVTGAAHEVLMARRNRTTGWRRQPQATGVIEVDGRLGWTVEQYAEKLGVELNVLRTEIRRGKLAVSMLGTRQIITAAEHVAYIARGNHA
jgi:hypothetical protein